MQVARGHDRRIASFRQLAWARADSLTANGLAVTKGCRKELRQRQKILLLLLFTQY